MKMTRVYGVFFTLAATLAVSGAFGQIPATGFVKVGATDGDAENKISLVQVGVALGFYAQPDAAFHPSYGSDGKLTNGFKWTWTSTPAATFSNATGTADGTSTTKANYTTVTFAAAGKYTLTVEESAPAAWALTCAPIAKTFDVFAFAAPSFTMGTGPTTPKCGDQSNVAFTAAIKSSGTPHIKYGVEKWSASIAVDGTLTPGTKISDVVAETAESFTTGWKYDQAVAATNAGTASVAAGSSNIALTTVLNTATATLADYTFTFTATTLAKPDGGTTEKSLIVYRMYLSGVNGSISRKSADVNQSTGANGTESYFGSKTAYYDVYVAAAPTTGPVFHIANNIAK